MDDVLLYMTPPRGSVKALTLSLYKALPRAHCPLPTTSLNDSESGDLRFFLRSTPLSHSKRPTLTSNQWISVSVVNTASEKRLVLVVLVGIP